MRQLLEHGHGREVERVARVVVKRADAALAEDDLLVAAGHDVLGAHEQLLERAGQTALEQDGLAQLAELTQEIEVLHIARADLNDIHILEQRQMLHAHDLGHNRQAGGRARRFEQLDAGGLEPLKIVGRGAGLERAAAQDVRAGGLDRLRDRDDLLLRLHGARPRNHDEVATADLHVADLNDGVLRVELAVAALEGLAHALDAVDDAEAADQIHVHVGRVADETEHGLIFALGNVDDQPLSLEPVDELRALCRFHAMFEYDDHDDYLRYNVADFLDIKKKMRHRLNLCRMKQTRYPSSFLHHKSALLLQHSKVISVCKIEAAVHIHSSDLVKMISMV